MEAQVASSTRQSDRWSYLWLVIGTVLGLFSMGQWTIPLATWLGTVLFLRFVRSQRVWLGVLLVWLAAFVIAVITFWNILGSGLGVPLYLITMAINTLVIGAVPYLVDRLLAPRLGGFKATLIFPTAVTGLEFLSLTTSPLGSMGASAYSQFQSLTLMQLVSLTGMWGITFLMSWFATVVNYAWERSFSWPRIWRGLAIFVGVLLAVLVYGSARLAFSQPATGTVRVAGLTAVDFRETQAEFFQTMNTDWEAFRQLAAARYDPYFEGTIREAQAGAKIVLWPEMAVQAAGEDEPALLARAREVARQEGIYLAMPLMTVFDDDRRSQNKLLVFDPAGEIVLEHYKYGGSMIEGFQPGDGVLRTVETPYGTLSGVICWDTDIPATVRQAGRNGTDILLSPSLDYRSVDPIHAQMAIFRAIENGVSVVRQSDNGLSVVTDPYGRTLAAVDHFTTSERVTVAQVPTQGLFTLYPVIGDLFAWLCVLGFVAMVVWGVFRWLRLRRARPPQAPAQAES